MSDHRRQTCQCGNDTYYIASELSDGDLDVWAECTECGRPTKTLGDGEERQRQWFAEKRE